MNLRREMAGALRSVRYDMARRDQMATDANPTGDADATYTGMSTFGVEQVAEQPVGPVRAPRRVRAVAAFGALAVAGAAGSYFAVVNGLGALLSGEPAQPDPYPLAIGDGRGAGDDTLAANAGMGRASADRPAQTPGAVAAATGAAVAGAVAGTLVVPQEAAPRGGAAPKPPAPRRQAAQQPGTAPADDCCLAPPVPTPTAPGGATPTDSGSTSPSPSVTDSGPATTDPSPSSAEPSESASDEPGGRRARHHRRH